MNGERQTPSDVTTSHSTKLSKNDSQVAGYSSPLSGGEQSGSSPDKGRLGGVEVLPACELCDQIGGTLLWQDASCRTVLVGDADYPGFCRVIWNRHIKEMTDLSASERQHFMATVFAVEAAIREVLQPDKINLASLGNLTPHLHWHVIPRYTNDKHFPQPIWGTAQREGTSSLPPGWPTRLMECVRSRLPG